MPEETTTDDPTLTAIVRRARCGRCDGNGFRLAPAEDARGEKIPGRKDRLECPDCDGNGIKLGLCRSLALRLARLAPGTHAEDSG